jgi:hypothetical protein
MMACMSAAAKWWADNPDAKLKFNPITLPRVHPGRAGVIGGLDQALELGVAGNSVTRKLLTAMNRATPNGGATVMMAEFALEQIFGIASALHRTEGE